MSLSSVRLLLKSAFKDFLFIAFKVQASLFQYLAVMCLFYLGVIDQQKHKRLNRNVFNIPPSPDNS